MKPQVTIIDYGMGNMLSVVRAFEFGGAEVLVTSSPDAVRRAERLVLPGVGAFADGMNGLRSLQLIEPIRQAVRNGSSFLGICLGMQMMLDMSEEFGQHEGLGLIPGNVVAIPSVGPDGTTHRIPHIGWSEIAPSKVGAAWSESILSGISTGTSAYFVHSFAAHPQECTHRLADCSYNGLTIAAAIRSGAMFGCQFHPEKSGPAGLRIIRNFLQMPAPAETAPSTCTHAVWSCQ